MRYAGVRHGLHAAHRRRGCRASRWQRGRCPAVGSNGRGGDRGVLGVAAVVLAKIETSRRVGVLVSPLAVTGTAGAPTAVPGLLFLTAAKHAASAISRLARMHWDFFMLH